MSTLLTLNSNFEFVLLKFTKMWFSLKGLHLWTLHSGQANDREKREKREREESVTLRTRRHCFFPSLQNPLIWIFLHYLTFSIQRTEVRPGVARPFSVVVAIDFGTTSSGYAFSFTEDPETIHMMRYLWYQHNNTF